VYFPAVRDATRIQNPRVGGIPCVGAVVGCPEEPAPAFLGVNSQSRDRDEPLHVLLGIHPRGLQCAAFSRGVLEGVSRPNVKFAIIANLGAKNSATGVAYTA
jgi:hypothetical protein